MLDRIEAKLLMLWSHRTKIVSLLALGAAYMQNNLAQLGHVLSPRWQGAILAFFGVVMFLIGLYNTFAPKDEP